MRVLLVPPKNNYPFPKPSIDIFGQGFPYIAGALMKAGHEVFGVNMNHLWCQDSAQLTLSKSLRKAITEYQPHLIGVGGLSANYSFVRDAIRFVRQFAPDIPIVCGGGIITYDHQYIFTDLRPDFAINGEGEESIVALANYLEKGGDINSIVNISYWDNDTPVFTKTAYSNTKLEDLPWPDYGPFVLETYLERFNQADNIFTYTRTRPRIMPITLGRSCPFKCTFCCHTTGPTYRGRSIDNAIEEIVYFHDRYHFNLLLVYDELFSTRKERITEFCTKIKKVKSDLKSDFDWTCALRVNNVDKDVLAEMKGAGCIFVGYGFESASPTVLKSMKKGITVDQIKRAIKLTDEAGLGVQANFIFGDIAETPETMHETLEFFNTWCTDKIVHLGPIVPYPGSKLFEHCINNGIIKDKKQYYDQIGCIGRYKINMTKMPDEEYFDLSNNIFKITDPLIHDYLPLKEAKIISCKQAGQFKFDLDTPLTSHRFLYDIKVNCPHCNEEVTYLYPLKTTKQDQSEIVRLFCAKCNKRFNINISDYINGHSANVSVPPPPLTPPTRGGGHFHPLRPRHRGTFPPPVPLTEGDKGGERMPGGGAELLPANNVENSLSKLFAAGNYAGAAMIGNQDEWQAFAALSLLGKSQEAIDGLSRFDHEDARFYTAVAYWMNGEDEPAKRLLKDIPTPHAQNLLAIISKPQIQVIAQTPWDWDDKDFQDHKFHVRRIGIQRIDAFALQAPFENIHNHYDGNNPPDFYFCNMAEWHILPLNLHELPCPVFGATADYDAHIQTVYSWLQIFDELIVASHTQWEEVRKLTNVPITSYLKLYGLPSSVPFLQPEPRDTDLFLSGTTLNPYHPDKVRIFHQILQMPEIILRYIDGFIDLKSYFSELALSKISYSYVRFPAQDGISTRGLEALAMGCAVVTQKESALAFYVDKEYGVVTYSAGENDLSEVIRYVLRNWCEFQKCANRGAELVRREFALPRIISQYLRFLTFLAAKPRLQRRAVQKSELLQKRGVTKRGFIFPETVNLMMLGLNLQRYEKLVKNDKSPNIFIDTAREVALFLAHGIGQLPKTPDNIASGRKLLNIALGIYKSGLNHFPKSLVLRFNFVRTVFHFGFPSDVDEALRLAEETLQSPLLSWEIDVMEDVFPWDFYSTFFNYRRYFDTVKEILKNGKAKSETLVKLMLASLHYYVGHYTGNIEHFQQATLMDPEFPFYTYHYARHLLTREGTNDFKEAIELLTKLAKDSMLFNEAFSMLEELRSKRKCNIQEFDTIAKTVYHFRKSQQIDNPTIDRDSWTIHPSQSLQPAGRD